MMDRILRFLPKGLLILAICLLVGAVTGDLVSLTRIGGAAKDARARAANLSEAVRVHAGQPRFTSPAKDSSRESGRVLDPWVNVARGINFHSYDFYPR